MATAAALGAAATALPAVQQGAGAAYGQMQEYYRHSLQVLAREQASFDYEKVFIQSVYGEILYFIAKSAYHLYWIMKQAQFMQSNPTALVGGILEGATFFSPPLNLMKWAWDTATGDEPTEEELQWEEEVKNDPVSFLKPFFEDYWFFMILGIPAVFALFEHQRVKKLRRKNKMLLR